jgi:ABC-2 type transport system ATP-binding protein
MIKVSNLTIRYPEVVAVDNVSIQLKEGIIYGLVGPNGAGKSSFIKALVGLIAEYDGDIYFDEFSRRKDRHIIKSLFGYAPEDPDLYPYLTGKEYLHMIADIRQVDANSQIKALQSDFGLDNVFDDLINRYSHGMRQKISFAAALIGEPKNLILDEALNGFDPISQYNSKNILLTLARNGHTILLSSHVLELVENWCQEIIILNEGKLLAEYTLEQIEDIKARTGKDFSEHFVSLVQRPSEGL